MIAGALLWPALGSAAGSIQATEGAPFSGQVGTGNACALSATIDWGDGMTSSGTLGSDGSISGSHTYAEEGSYNGSFHWTCDTPGSGSGSFTATVGDAPLSATGTPVSATVGQGFSGTVATFTDADPGGLASDYAARIDWGDGSSSAGTITGQGPGFGVTSSHTYGTAASFPTAVTITDQGGASVVAHGTATATGSGPPPACGSPPVPPAPIVIDFECLRPGTEIADQYAAFGVRFTAGFPGYAGRLWGTIAAPGSAIAQSGSQVADITCMPGATQFCYDETGGTFTVAHRHLQVYVGDFGPGSERTTAQLVGFAADGRVVAKSSVVPLVGGSAVHTLLSVDSTARDISGFQVIGAGASDAPEHVAIDDLSYDDPSPAELKPDFAVVGPQYTVGLDPGTTYTSFLTIRRIDGSTGPITFHALTAPVGVAVLQDEIVPNPTSGGDLSTVEVKIRVRSDAPADPGSQIVIAGSPGGPSVGPAPHLATIPVFVRSHDFFDVRITGMEITQVAQPLNDVFFPSPVVTPPVPYQGVTLRAGGKTIVRLYANARLGPDDGVSGVQAYLYAFGANGAPLPFAGSGYALASDGGPMTLPRSDLVGVTSAEQASTTGDSDNAVFTFTLPSNWAADRIDLRAVLDPSGFTGCTGASCEQECQTVDCRANNELTVTGVPFVTRDPVDIVPIEITGGGGAPPPDPNSAFAGARQLSPRPLYVTPYYQAVMDVSDVVSDNDDAPDFLEDMGERLADASAVFGDSNVYFPFALHTGLFTPDQKADSFENNGVWLVGDQPEAVSNTNRPYTGVAHELFHGLGLAHASSACGGAANGSAAAPWPDPYGYIESIGMDSSGVSPYTVIAGSPDFTRGDCTKPPTSDCGGFSPTQWFDVMSYCATGVDTPGNGLNAWLSAVNWQLMIQNPLPTLQPPRSGQRANAPPAGAPLSAFLRVSAVVDPAGGIHLTEEPGTGHFLPGGRPSGFTLVARSAAGAVLSRKEMTGAVLHDDRGTAVEVLGAWVPAGGVETIQVQQHGHVLAQGSRPARHLSLKLLAPGPGFRIRRGHPVLVRWSGGERDASALTVGIDYTVDAGRSYRTVFTGPDRGALTLSPRMFPASGHLRVRIRVDDGWREASVTSASLRSDGSPPAVLITSPAARSHLMQDAAAFLSGQAFEDRSRPLTGHRLRWLLGRRLLGTGQTISAAVLPPGLDRIRLLATDASGRTASAEVIVIIRAAQPAFTVLRYPQRIGPRGGRIALVVATNVPATLLVGRHRYAVGFRLRRIVVRVGAGKLTPVVLQLRLVAGGLRGLATPIIPRTGG